MPGPKTETSFTSSQDNVKFFGWRQTCHEILESGALKGVMSIVILLNAIQVVYESDVAVQCKWEDSQSACDQEDGWLFVMNWVYLCVYTVEMCGRIYVHRIHCFCEPWDVFDAIIILAGVVSEVLGGLIPSTGILRLFRLLRLARAAHFLKLPKEFHIMIHGFLSALTAISGGAILVVLMLTLWAVVMVALLNDPNHSQEMLAFYEGNPECTWAPKAWSSIAKTLFTLTQLMVFGEGWECNAYPLMERNPWIAGLFMGIFFTVIIGMTNLILAVIVDKALQTHEDNMRQEADRKMKEKERAIYKFVEVCQELDINANGTLSLDELLHGYDSNQKFQDACNAMDIAHDDLEVLYHMMDVDHSGDVSFEEFATELHKIKNDNLQTVCSFTKHHVIELRTLLHEIAQKIDAGSLLESTDEEPTKLKEEPKLDEESTGDFRQLRATVERRALEACGLLEQHARALEESGKCAELFVDALQASLNQKANTLLAKSRPNTSDEHRASHSSSKRLSQNLAAPRPTELGTEDEDGCKPLLDELKQIEERLVVRFDRMLRESASENCCSRPGLRGQSLLCLPGSAHSSSGLVNIAREGSSDEVNQV